MTQTLGLPKPLDSSIIRGKDQHPGTLGQSMDTQNLSALMGQLLSRFTNPQFVRSTQGLEDLLRAVVWLLPKDPNPPGALEISMTQQLMPKYCYVL